MQPSEPLRRRAGTYGKAAGRQPAEGYGQEPHYHHHAGGSRQRVDQESYGGRFSGVFELEWGF